MMKLLLLLLALALPMEAQTFRKEQRTELKWTHTFDGSSTRSFSIEGSGATKHAVTVIPGENAITGITSTITASTDGVTFAAPSSCASSCSSTTVGVTHTFTGTFRVIRIAITAAPSTGLVDVTYTGQSQFASAAASDGSAAANYVTYWADPSQITGEAAFTYNPSTNVLSADNLTLGTNGVITATTAVIVNEAGADVDVRAESDTNSNHFIVDAGHRSGVGGFGFGTTARSDAFIIADHPAVTANANDSWLRMAVATSNAVTVPTGTAPIVASLNVEEPNITATGTVTNAATVRIGGAPTEGASNYALLVNAGLVRMNSYLQFGGLTFAALGTPANGHVVYCSDCTKATPCAGSGNGALAKRLNGAWDCD